MFAANWRRLFPHHCVWSGKATLDLLPAVAMLLTAMDSNVYLTHSLPVQFALSAVLSIARSISSRGKRDDFDDFN